MFYTGQKVVRVASDGSGPIKRLSIRFSFPKIDEIVTIRGINVHPHVTLLWFMEHDNAHLAGTIHSRIEPGFPAHCFRPLCEPKTSIEIFRKALTGDLIGEEA